IFTMAGGSCALDAKIAEAAGYECAYMSGAGTAATILGLPDAGLITMTEMVQNAERMANCISIPLVSDSDQGFGNAINVRRTVQEFIRAGVAGIHIEDQPMPKRCGAVLGKTVLSVEEAVGKYRAAVDAKLELDPEFVIIARCDARGAAGGSIEETIKRLNAYKKAGVDVLYFEMPLSLDECRAVRAEVEGPLMSTTALIDPPPTPDELEEIGFSCVFGAGLITAAGLRASWEWAHDYMKRGHEAEVEWGSMPTEYPMPHMFDIVGFPQVFEWEEKYLPSEELKERYKTSIGGYDPRKAVREKAWSVGETLGKGR
ncbi:MAG: isocitrate lyase/PEP mutase family protein, partial [Dehalococcoidia bacterium]|nr:isocitrate lyase/PEP mutase family protein [Dehalococcoidia bacterium]